MRLPEGLVLGHRVRRSLENPPRVEHGLRGVAQQLPHRLDPERSEAEPVFDMLESIAGLIEQVAPGFALDAVLMRHSEAPVRLGLELGTRVGFLDRETWTLATVRMAFHY